MLVLGIETSCDETGVAVYDSGRGLLAHALHSQLALHDAYGGVVPELASRDHIRRLLPLVREVLRNAGARELDLDAVAYTQGPGLAGALLVGAAVANSLAFGLGVRAIGVHHLEGHLLSPLLKKKHRLSRLSRCWFRGATRNSCAWQASATTNCWAKPWTTPPGKPSTRQRNCSGSATRGGPRSPSSRKRAGPIALRSRVRCSSSWRKTAISISASAGSRRRL